MLWLYWIQLSMLHDLLPSAFRFRNNHIQTQTHSHKNAIATKCAMMIDDEQNNWNQIQNMEFCSILFVCAWIFRFKTIEYVYIQYWFERHQMKFEIKNDTHSVRYLKCNDIFQYNSNRLRVYLLRLNQLTTKHLVGILNSTLCLSLSFCNKYVCMSFDSLI